MKRLVEFPLEGGSSILVEITDAGERRPTRGLSPSQVTERAEQTFEAAAGKVVPAAEALIARLRSLSDAPDEIQLEFGLQLSGELGAFIASVAAEANFRVTVGWRRGPA